MNGKIPSAITGIKLNRATFSEAGIDNLTFINFFYGNNGAGKSSIAHAIEENDGITWAGDKDASDYDVLVYNREFISRNISNYDNLPGVFTMNETNIKIQQEVDEKNAEKKKLSEERTTAQETRDKKEAAKGTILTTFQNECWSATAEVRADFEKALDGKKTKKGLADAVLAEEAPTEHDLAELKRLYDVAFDDSARAYNEFRKAGTSLTYPSLPGMALLGEIIVSSSDTPFAQFIKAINASDWVRTGHDHYTEAADGKCPYCQQTLPANFEAEITACFDAQYQGKIKELSELATTYQRETDSVIRELTANLSDVMESIPLSDYKTKLALLESTYKINNDRLADKLSEPAKPVSLEDTDAILKEIWSLIDGINTEIKANNKVVSERRSSKTQCKIDIMQHLAFMLEANVKSYLTEKKRLEKEVADLDAEGQRLRKSIATLTADIAALNSKVVNTEAAITNINKILTDSGFQGFSIRAKEGVENTYEVIRSNGEIAYNLSEGERNFIAFLYFYHLVRGSLKSDEVKEKIVVIDDPVSSMDSSALFLVSAIVREMVNVCRNNTEYLDPKVPGDYIKQIFILTHNVYFHREITYQQTGYYNCVSFYIVRKVDNMSDVRPCTRPSAEVPSEMENYNPVQNSYAALWDELRDMKSPIPTMNVMRRILEYYFLQLCGFEGSDLRERILDKHKDAFIKEVEGGKPDMTDYQLASSLLAYINNPHGISDGLNYVEETDDVEAYKRVFKLIFYALDQDQHYDMMTGTTKRK